MIQFLGEQLQCLDSRRGRVGGIAWFCGGFVTCFCCLWVVVGVF